MFLFLHYPFVSGYLKFKCLAQGYTGNGSQEVFLSTLRSATSLGLGMFNFFFPVIFRFTLYAVDSRGSHSESSFVSVRTSCPMVDDSRAEGILTSEFFSCNYLYFVFLFHLFHILHNFI